MNTIVNTKLLVACRAVQYTGYALSFWVWITAMNLEWWAYWAIPLAAWFVPAITFAVIDQALTSRAHRKSMARRARRSFCAA